MNPKLFPTWLQVLEPSGGEDSKAEDERWTGRVKALARTVRDHAKQHQTTLNEMSTDINERIDGMGTAMKSEMKGMNERIDGMGTAMNERIDGMGTAMNERIDGLSDQMMRLQLMLEGVCQHLGSPVATTTTVTETSTTTSTETSTSTSTSTSN